MDHNSSGSSGDFDINAYKKDKVPFYYQYNPNENDFLKEKKAEMRLKDLYRILNPN